MKTCRINEIFYSVQGEGVRAGTANVFVRFADCNLRCKKDGPAGFDCDTEFVSGTDMTLEEIEEAAREASGGYTLLDPRIVAVEATEPGRGTMTVRGTKGRALCEWLVLTGGEPALQVDKEFCDYFHRRGYKLAIETNGTIELPLKEKRCWPGPPGDQEPTLEDLVKRYLLDWITVSPKSAEHTIRQPVAHEVKYVRNAGQGIPEPSCKALHYLLSPAFEPGVAQPDGTTLHRTSPGAVDHCARLVLANPQWRLTTQAHKGWKVR